MCPLSPVRCFRGGRRPKSIRMCRNSAFNPTVSSVQPVRKVWSFTKKPANQSGLPKAETGLIMKFMRNHRSVASTSGFTLAEVLAALVFMAIVIPVAVEGLQIANRAGQVAVRKGEAMRVADRILNESIVTTNWSKSGQSGSVIEG